MAALEQGPGVTDQLGTEEIIVEIGGLLHNLQAIKSRSTTYNYNKAAFSDKYWLQFSKTRFPQKSSDEIILHFRKNSSPKKLDGP